MITGFKPLVPQNPTCLILGTMPSVVSLEEGFYYGHPRNAFWPIISRYCGRELNDIAAKKQALLDADILLWDVLSSCERLGSLDSAIKRPVANDFASLFRQFPSLKKIIFNGKEAEKLFKRCVIKDQILPNDLEFICVPSTSPANAALTLEDKWLLWREVLPKIQ